MLHSNKVSLMFVLLIGFSACGKDKGADTGDKVAPKVEVSPNMMAFTEALKGKSRDVSEALKKWGAEGLDKKDMDAYDLSSPHVTAVEKRGDKECYTFDAKAGATTRTYDACWAKGKIAEIVDKGLH